MLTQTTPSPSLPSPAKEVLGLGFRLIGVRVGGWGFEIRNSRVGGWGLEIRNIRVRVWGHQEHIHEDDLHGHGTPLLSRHPLRPGEPSRISNRLDSVTIYLVLQIGGDQAL